jgi:hypothetical protein
MSESLILLTLLVKCANLILYMNNLFSSRMSVEYIYAGKPEERGSKASKSEMSTEFAAASELSVPFVLMRSKSHKNIFAGDGSE